MVRILVCIFSLWITASHAVELVPGASQFGEHRYIEYIPGDLPIVITAPHGGREEPAEIPDRSKGVVETDANTEELARAVADVIHTETGHYAHLVICHLHRRKLDPNRDITEAAAGNPLAEQAWREHHAFIDRACAAAVAKFGVAFLIDLHGHSHPGRRLELGYLHTTEELQQSDATLNAPAIAAASSLALIATHSRLPYSELLRGKSSLGALLESHGFQAAPSPSMPEPVGLYFRGGYTVSRHCRASEKVAGLQIECFREGARDTPENRLALAHALVSSLATFLPAQLGVKLNGESLKLISGAQ